MKERPILFSAPMVRAILEGRKTQTRRVMKIQPPSDSHHLCTCVSTTGDKKIEGRHHWGVVDGYKLIESDEQYFSSPYGYAGDRLWVRETWQHSNFPLGPLQDGCDLFYRADYFDDPHGMDGEKSPEGKYRTWKPSIHMPRRASRITLEITNLRVERLKDITPQDALAEGVFCPEACYAQNGDRAPVHLFANLWEDINGPGSWDINPWVWAIEFKRVVAA